MHATGRRSSRRASSLAAAAAASLAGSPRHAGSSVASTSLLRARAVASTSAATRQYSQATTKPVDSFRRSPARNPRNTPMPFASTSRAPASLQIARSDTSIRLQAAQVAQPARRRDLHTASRQLEEQRQSRQDSSLKLDGPAQASRSQSIQRTSGSKTAESADAASAPSSDGSDKEVPKSPKDISLGEVRRLVSLAKPEKRTLSIALGLVGPERRSFQRLTFLVARRIIGCIAVCSLYSGSYHRSLHLA